MYNDGILKKLFNRLRTLDLVCVTAESLTGGLVGASITAIPGASDIYWGGFICYSIDAKVRLLGIDKSIIERFGVVSEQTAIEMARCALLHSDADISVALTGVAGPGGGNEQTPVGTVWIAVLSKSKEELGNTRSTCLHLAGSRNYIRNKTVREAIKLLLAHLDRK